MESQKMRFSYKMIIISTIVLLIMLSLIIFLGIRIDFLINDELTINLDPVDKSIITHYFKKENVTFEFENDNTFLCKSECTYALIDLRDSSIVQKETLILNSKSKISRTYEVTPDRYAAGQEIYSFEVSCRNLRSFLCRTNGEEELESSLLTVSYDISGEEKSRLLDTKDKINSYLYLLKSKDSKLAYTEYLLNKSSLVLSKTSFNSNLIFLNQELAVIHLRFDKLLQDTNSLVTLWKDYQYLSVSNILETRNYTLSSLSQDIDTLSLSTESNVGDYNLLVSDLNILISNSSNIESILAVYVNSSLGELANDYKANLSRFYKDLTNPSYDDLEGIKSRLDSLNLQLSTIKSVVGNKTFTESNILSESILVPINLSVYPGYLSSIETNLSLPDPICCAFNQCRPCCTSESCKQDTKLYPILLLHGHSFNKDESPQTSLDSLVKLQRNLTSLGIINAGQIDLKNLESIPPGEYGRSGNPVSARASYYYLHYYDLGTYSVISQKSEKIENYALRLNELVEILKERTGSDKVIIISHSMGGLVSREYLRLFGDSSIYKLILVGTPNKGISGRALDICGFLGSQKECDDMKKDSLFLKRLNQAKSSKNAKIYTISGVGCDTNGVNGDGILEQSSAYLEDSKNYNLTGVCNSLFGNYLHNEMINPSKYPEIYSLVSQILDE